MAINVEHETGSLKDWDYIIESCIFCGNGSRTWHKESNSPICVGCAVNHSVSDISLAKKISYDKYKRENMQ